MSVSSKIRLRRLPTSTLTNALRASQSSMVRRAPSRRPSDAGLRKNTKNPSGGWGRAFWTESGLLISVSKSKIPPPPIWRVPKIGKKRRFDTFFGRFRFWKFTKRCELLHVCVLTSFAGAMQKRRKCCKYQYFLDPRYTKHCKYQRF